MVSDRLVRVSRHFPPTDYDATGGVSPVGLVIPVPMADDTQIELQIGYEVVAPGKSNKLGVRVRYAYQGRTHEVIVPSRLAICAPATVKCTAEGATDGLSRRCAE